MKKIIKISLYIITFASLINLSLSCEKYLDKSPEADISEDEAFSNFTNFQGYIEQMYNCIVDPDKCGAWNNYSFADENLNNKRQYNFDLGNYWNNEMFFYGKGVSVTSLNGRNRRVWEWSWYGITVANQAIDRLNSDKNSFVGTKEEKDLLMGQALFFRGWFYFQICRFWGGMPYITHPIKATEDMFTEDFKRLTFQETALKMADDFRAAANLLPDHWDNTSTGKATSGDNNQRINKFFALGYLGKALLFAASPMPNEEATGNNSFNPDLCKRAAEAFGELLKLSDDTSIYKLETWDNYESIFINPKKQPTGGTEVIMRPTIYDPGRVRWSTIGQLTPSTLGLNTAETDCPTQNIINNFGMDNGLPIDDASSGYDANNPWVNRDPRFYKVIVKDGDRISSMNVKDHYAQIYNGGRHRSSGVTGYFCRKFTGLGSQFTMAFANSMQEYVPYLRMADIYLMYAEAVNFMTSGGPNATSGNYSMSAVNALNAVRNRAQLPNLAVNYFSDKNVFFETLIRERAVELLMEGKRFDDLRRWNRIDDPRYLDKTVLDYDRGQDGKPINIVERIVIHRVASNKHKWLPIQVQFTKQYPGFYQNPGW